MEQGFLRQRRNLIIISLVLFTTLITGAPLESLKLLGMQLNIEKKNTFIILGLMWAIWAWFFLRYIQYYIHEASHFVEEYVNRVEAKMMLTSSEIIEFIQPNIDEFKYDTNDKDKAYRLLISKALEKLGDNIDNQADSYSQISLQATLLTNFTHLDAASGSVLYTYEVKFVERVSWGKVLAKANVKIDNKQLKSIKRSARINAYLFSPLGTDNIAPIILAFIPLMVAMLHWAIEVMPWLGW